MNNHKSKNFHNDLIITPKHNKNNFYTSCNSIEMSLDNDDRHRLIDSKYYKINELNSLQTKQN